MPDWLSSVLGILNAGLQIGLKWFGLKNSSQELAAKNATTESKIDQDSTRDVQDAIEKNDVSGLQK